MKKHSSFIPKTWLRAGLLTAFAASLSLNLQAQTAPAKQWDKAVGGNADDDLKVVRQTSDGGYILGGSSQSGITGDKTQDLKGDLDYWVVKLDANGSKVWDKTFGGAKRDDLFALQQTSDGGYILGGYSESGISGDKTQTKGYLDYWIIKLDANGNKTWDKAIGGRSNNYLTSLQQTSDGGYILGGYSASGIGGDKTQGCQGQYDYWVAKLDASGNKTWDKTFGGSDTDQLYSLQQTSDGGYILGGYSVSYISGDKTQGCQGQYDYWVVKIDAIGNKIWDKTLGGSKTDQLYSLQQTSDGGYIVGGTSESGISSDKSQGLKGYTDCWVVKLDASGNKSWDKTFGGSGGEYLYSLQQTSGGGYILGGTSTSGINGDKSEASKGGWDYWTIQLDANGNKIWDKTFGGAGNDELHSLQQTSDGGYILGGWTYSPIGGDKTSPPQGGHDYWVVKLASSVTGIKESEANLTVSIFPNPSQGKFNLQLSGITAPAVEVTVSDLLGRVVFRQELKATDQHISQELTVPSAKGIYLLQLKAGDQITTRKIVVE